MSPNSLQFLWNFGKTIQSQIILKILLPQTEYNNPLPTTSPFTGGGPGSGTLAALCRGAAGISAVPAALGSSKAAETQTPTAKPRGLSSAPPLTSLLGLCRAILYTDSPEDEPATARLDRFVFPLKELVAEIQIQAE